MSHRRATAEQPQASGFRRRLFSPLGATIAGVTALLVVVAAAAAVHLHTVQPTDGSVSAASAPAANPGTSTMFAYLAAQHTNFCSLERSTVESDPNTMHIQGACCSALDMAKYQAQVRDLRQFASIAQIMPDPYDVPVPLARALFHDDDAIVLDAAQKATYDAAMGMTEDKGPCCCHCWRWSMTEGLARRLITVNYMDAATVARVVDLVNGCGGPPGTVTTPSAHG